MKKLFTRLIIFCFSIVNFSAVFAQIPTNGLVAYYPFDSNANDASGNDHHGTVYGSTLTKDRFGNVNSAYSFDGKDDYILVPDDSTTLRAKSAVTVSAWVFAKDTAVRHTVLVKRENTFDFPYNSYGLSASRVAAKQYWQASNSLIVNVDDDTPIVHNKWVHLVNVYDGDSIYLYVDGRLTNYAPLSGDLTYTSMEMYIGTGVLIADQFMAGNIDDIKIYNRALSRTELQELYKEDKSSVSINNNNENTRLKINIYPNPAKHFIMIENNSYLPGSNYFAEITNILGQTIIRQSIPNKQNKIDISEEIGKGIYFVKVYNNNKQVETKKIILE